MLRRLGACLTALAACALLLARVTPPDLPPSLGGLPAWLAAGPVETRVVALAALAAWACLAWLAFVLVAVAAEAFPRGRVRDAAERVLGIAVVGVAAGALAAGPAAADGPFDRPAGPAASPPVTARAASPPVAARAAASPMVVVAPADTLWGIAARRLGARATAALTAATWPRWYAANRPLIGPDPGRLVPGQPLVPPPHGGDR
ncbi:MAG TPA: hypothetical protein VNQ77_20605 [Frankiaceae bacterium]|nr:hypothetical protein [Frankiaceae bacterium]